jgi:hypothetical protein
MVQEAIREISRSRMVELGASIGDGASFLLTLVMGIRKYSPHGIPCCHCLSRDQARQR